MKNIIISMLITYIFYTDFCEVKLWYLMPFIFLIFWAMLAGVEDLIRDYQETVRRGRRLQRTIKRMERGW